MLLISIDEVPPVGFDWVADSAQISLALANVFHHQTNSQYLPSAVYQLSIKTTYKTHTIQSVTHGKKMPLYMVE